MLKGSSFARFESNQNALRVRVNRENYDAEDTGYYTPVPMSARGTGDGVEVVEVVEVQDVLGPKLWIIPKCHRLFDYGLSITSSAYRSRLGCLARLSL